MKLSERKEVEQRIVAEITRTEKEIAALTELTKPIAPDDAIGRLTRMEAINAKSVNEAALSAARVKLLNLKRALANIDEPEFGTCYECGEPIPVPRILLMPEATMCVSCAEEHD